MTRWVSFIAPALLPTFAQGPDCPRVNHQKVLEAVRLIRLLLPPAQTPKTVRPRRDDGTWQTLLQEHDARPTKDRSAPHAKHAHGAESTKTCKDEATQEPAGHERQVPRMFCLRQVRLDAIWTSKFRTVCR